LAARVAVSGRILAYALAMTTANFDLGDDAPIFEAPERVSLLAIFALVFSLLCFVPGMGLIGSIMGVAGLIVIGASRGRLSGRGMAIAGIVLGLIFSMIWAGVGLGMMKVWSTMKTEMIEPTSQMLSDIEGKNYAAARTRFNPVIGPTITDAQFDAFRNAYQTDAGAYQGMPTSVVEVWTSYAAIGKAMKNVNESGPSGTIIPVPGNFANGPRLIVLHMQPGNTKKPGDGMWSNLTILSGTGAFIELLPKAGQTTGVPDEESTDTPSTPDAPATPEGGTPEKGAETTSPGA